MSSMLTPASPRARASSAIVPGRLATTIRSSRSGPASALGLEQPAPVLAGRRVPGGDGVAVAAADQLGRLAAGGAPTASTASATASRLLAKMSAQIAGLEPATRVVSRKLGPTSGSRSESRVSSAAASVTRALATHVREVADRRHQPVVGRGVDRLRAGAEAGDGALQAVVEEAAGALCRGQVPARALEEVLAGVLDPGGLGPGQRVAADEALVVAERRDQLALGRADVGDDGLRAARRQRRRAPAPAAPRPGRRRRRRRPRRRPRRASRRRGRARRAPPPAPASPGCARSRPPRRRAAAARRARSSRRSGRPRGRRSAGAGALLNCAGPRSPRRSARGRRRCRPSRDRRR